MTRSPLLLPLLAALGMHATGCPAQVASGVKTPSATQMTRAASGCEGAALALPPDAVVAIVDGETIRAADLGDEFAQAEKAALYEYCATVHRMRTRALDDRIHDILVGKAASAAGQSADEFVRARLDQAMASEPTEEEIQAFFSERAGPGAPPLDAVRPQVVAALQREKAGKLVQEMLGSLREGAVIEARLPDVRPPAQDVDVPVHTPTSGPADATVSVVEFADFECPYCSVAAQTLGKMKTLFEGQKVRFAFRHFPLSFHPNARRAAEFTQCAQAQGKFWQLHDKIFANPSAMEESSLRGYLAEVGLDEGLFNTCLESGVAGAQVDLDMKRAQELGVNGTPTFYVNGRKLDEPSPEAIEAAIRAELQGS